MIQNQGECTLRLMCLKVAGGGDLLCQGTNDLAWGGLAVGELGGGRRKLWLFNKILTGY